MQDFRKCSQINNKEGKREASRKELQDDLKTAITTVTQRTISNNELHHDHLRSYTTNVYPILHGRSSQAPSDSSALRDLPRNHSSAVLAVCLVGLCKNIYTSNYRNIFFHNSVSIFQPLLSISFFNHVLNVFKM